MRRPAAVDVEHLTGDVPRLGEQEAHRARDVLRAAGPLEQRVVDDGGAPRVVETVLRPNDRPGRNGIDAHLGRQFDGQRARQAEQAGLGRAVERIAGERALAVDVGDVDDRPVRRPQLRRRRLRQEERRLEVAADEVVPGGQVDAPERRGEERRGVVDQCIERAEALDARIHKHWKRGGVEQVGLHQRRRRRPPGVELVGQRQRIGARRAVMDHHVGAGGVQFAGYRAANALGRPGHQYRFTDHLRLPDS